MLTPHTVHQRQKAVALSIGEVLSHIVQRLALHPRESLLSSSLQLLKKLLLPGKLVLQAFQLGQQLSYSFCFFLLLVGVHGAKALRCVAEPLLDLGFLLSDGRQNVNIAVHKTTPMYTRMGV